MASEPLQPDDVEQLSEMLQALQKRVEEGEMTVSTATRYRLDGAVIAIQAVLGELDDLRQSLLGDPG